MNELQPRHLPEFKRAVANNRFEIADDGILFPEQKIILRGTLIHNVNGLDERIDHNLVPTEGLNWLLDKAFAATGAAMYMALYSGAVTPSAALTAANFNSTCAEITSGSEGYSEANRVAYSPAAAAAAVKNNYASPAAFTIVTATTLTVNGIALLTVNTKGSTSGALLSAARFASARTFNNTDVFNVKYQLGGTST